MKGPSFIPCASTRQLEDFSEWISIDKRKPPLYKLVQITDSDDNGWCDFVFHARLQPSGDYLFDDSPMYIAGHIISYWKPLDD